MNERDDHGYPIVPFDAWVDLDRMAALLTAAGHEGHGNDVGRYGAYRVLKAHAPSLLRVTFRGVPEGGRRRDLAAPRDEAEAAVATVMGEQQRRAEQLDEEKRVREQARSKRPARLARVGEAREAVSDARRAISGLRRRVRSTVEQRRGALYRQYRLDQGVAQRALVEQLDALREDVEVQLAGLNAFRESEERALNADHTAELKHLNAQHEIDEQALPDIVAEELNIDEQIEAFEAAIAAAQIIIDARGYASKAEMIAALERQGIGYSE